MSNSILGICPRYAVPFFPIVVVVGKEFCNRHVVKAPLTLHRGLSSGKLLFQGSLHLTVQLFVEM